MRSVGIVRVARELPGFTSPLLGLLTSLLALLASGCIHFFGFVPVANHGDRIRLATEEEHKKCDSQSVDPRFFSPEIVESVEPLYSHVSTSGSNIATRLRGAEVHLRPQPGMTLEYLTRVLQCRSARLVLGRVEAPPNEPYWLPDGWVKIDVRSDSGSFVVALDGEDLSEAKEILARAQAFAAQAK
jgi:hypothetical protein